MYFVPIYGDRLIGLLGRVFAYGLRDDVPSQVG